MYIYMPAEIWLVPKNTHAHLYKQFIPRSYSLVKVAIIKYQRSFTKMCGAGYICGVPSGISTCIFVPLCTFSFWKSMLTTEEVSTVVIYHNILGHCSVTFDP